MDDLDGSPFTTPSEPIGSGARMSPSLLSIFAAASATLIVLPEVAASLLWYEQPAAAWNEALPLGNGRLGAMVFGDPKRERVQLNEESLWAGAPVEAWPKDFASHLSEVRRLIFAGRRAEATAYGLAHLTASPTAYRSYEPLGDIWVELERTGSASTYRRELDLADGIARASWTAGGATFQRETFVSAPDDVLALRLTTDRAGTLALTVRLGRHKDAQVTVGQGGTLRLDGQIIDVEANAGGYDDNPGGSGPGGRHMRFAGRLCARPDAGSVEPTADGTALRISGATTVVLLFTACTDYRLSALNFDRSIDPGADADRILERAAAKSWDTLRAAHLSEHRPKFGRVTLNLGGDPARDAMPTDARLAAVRRGGDDPALIPLLFHYGRYLLMACSRPPGRLPANLQGIWNELPWAPWEADYHLNINLQMNYWPARTANLAETAEPLLDWFEAVTQRGRDAAQRLYGADGWVAFLASTPFGRVTPSGSFPQSQFDNSSLDPLCGTWLAAELFDHYQFTRQHSFLSRLWPILEGASEFTLDYLVEAPDGTLVINPSTSPENSYYDPDTRSKIRITHASTYHLTLVRALFDATTRAATILATGETLRARMAAAMEKLPPFRVGPDGRLQEWIEPYREPEPGHRHMSHLLGLHPFDLITPQTPELFAAARKVVDTRLEHGGGGPGWSRAWMINFFARLRDGEGACKHTLEFLRASTLPNLFCGPLFQVDGNFGVTAGISEMLLQSHERRPSRNSAGQGFIVDLLPATPKAWRNGSVRGLSARGGLVVDFEWNDGRPTTILLHSRTGGPCHLRWRNQLHTVNLRSGETLEFHPFSPAPPPRPPLQ